MTSSIPIAGELILATKGSVGYDLQIVSIEPYGPWAFLAKTGVYLRLPPGMCAEVRPRSSTIKHGVLVQHGTIDQDYTGEVGIVFSLVQGAVKMPSAGDRIAQLVFSEVVHPLGVKAVRHSKQRGQNGFGSSGK